MPSPPLTHCPARPAHLLPRSTWTAVPRPISRRRCTVGQVAIEGRVGGKGRASGVTPTGAHYITSKFNSTGCPRPRGHPSSPTRHSQHSTLPPQQQHPSTCTVASSRRASAARSRSRVPPARAAEQLSQPPLQAAQGEVRSTCGEGRMIGRGKKQQDWLLLLALRPPAC